MPTTRLSATNIRAGSRIGLATLLALLAVHPGASAAELIAVQCTIDSYRSSYAPRPDLYIIQVDLDARAMITYYGSLPLKMTRREIRGIGKVDGGWQASVSIDRATGRFEAGTDRIEGGKYSYVAIKGACILPPELQGTGYKPASGT